MSFSSHALVPRAGRVPEGTGTKKGFKLPIRELVRLKVEVIVAGGSNTIRAAQHATRTIPIVMAGTGDAVASGFVASLARPGGTSRA